MAIVTSLFHSGYIYDKTHIQSIYRPIRGKLKPGKVVIINSFRRRILLYSPSRQMTFYMLDLLFYFYLFILNLKEKNYFYLFIFSRTDINCKSTFAVS